MTTPTILNQINQRKREEIAEAIKQVSLDEIKAQAALADAPRGFVKAMQARLAAGQSAVIAEIKKLHLAKVCCVIRLILSRLLNPMSAMVLLVCRY